MGDRKGQSKRFVPEPMETTTKSRRAKFAPEPVETAVRSSRASQDHSSEHKETPQPTGDAKPNFLPEPVETSTGSSKFRPAEAEKTFGSDNKPRKFAPEPVQMTAQSTRNRRGPSPESATEDDQSLSQSPTSQEPVGNFNGRSFAPQLLETSRRSRRSSDEGRDRLPGERTKALSEEDGEFLRKLTRRRVENGLPPAEADVVHSVRSGTSPLRQERSPSSMSRGSARQHSFRIPNLDPIESSESDTSEKSRSPSLSASPSASSDSSGILARQSKKLRETCDDRSSRYLLNLAAKAAEKQLEDQAMAAFPNSDFHEPVDHFAVDRESDEFEQEPAIDRLSRQALNTVAASRRESDADLASELQAMRKQKEKAQNHQEHPLSLGNVAALPTTGNRASSAVRQSELKANNVAAATAGGVSHDPKRAIEGWQKNAGLQSTKNMSSPPMLGQDIHFRMSKSPRATKLDAEHGPSLSSPIQGDQLQSAGLWMGSCFVKGGQSAVPRTPQRGLMTPAVEKADPFSTLSFDGSQSSKGPASPPIRRSSQPISPARSIASEDDIDREFPDEFVSQVYNYLSLGFPALGRKFDDELSKISRIPVEQLKTGDQGRTARGFVGVGDGPDTPTEQSDDTSSGRWLALRLYIREWARQHPEMTTDGLGFDAWGVRARRGSWAL